MADTLANIPAFITASFDVGGDVNFLAVVVPIVASVDTVAPVGSAVTLLSVPVSKTDPLVIQVDDASMVRYVLANIKYPDGSWEVAFDGLEFSPIYRAYSSLTVTSGLRQTISLRREGGWPYSPTVTIRAFDGSGNMS